MSFKFFLKNTTIHGFRDSVQVLILHGCYYDTKNFEQNIQVGRGSKGESEILETYASKNS